MMRMMLNLEGKEAEALLVMKKRTGFTKTAIVRRAIILHIQLDEAFNQGKKLVIRGMDGSETEVVLI